MDEDYDGISKRAKEIITSNLDRCKVRYSSVEAVVLTGTRKRVGVQGDERTEYYPLEISINSEDSLPKSLLEAISTEICNQLPLNTVLLRI